MPIGLIFVLSLLGASCLAVWTAVAIREWKTDQPDPILPSELDDWDAEFTRLTGKSIWQARCEANPELCKSAMTLGSALNNINPYQNELMRQIQGQAFDARRLTQAALAVQMNLQQQDPSQLSGLLGGLGNIGGLFH